MPQRELIKDNLIKKFSFLQDKIITPRPRRVILEVGLKDFVSVFEYSVKEMNFNHLCTITCLDEPKRFVLIYHLASDGGFLLNIKISVPKENPVVNTVTNYFPGADIYEREIMDLFGVCVKGLAEGNRYPLTDDWPIDEHPLRKDWKPGGRQNA